jgi:hypothetical protein
MRWRMFRWAALAVIVAAGLAASGCDSPPAGSKTAANLIPQMEAAARAAKSVRIVGLVDEGSQTIDIDMSFSRNWVVGTAGSNGATFFLLTLDGKTYIKADAAFLKVAKAPASACAVMCGKYVELPAASATQLTGSISMQSIVGAIFSKKTMGPVASSGCVFSPATVSGQSVLQCSQGGYTIDVAAHGTPYPVLFTYPHGKQRIAFTDWNSATAPAAPPANQVLNVNKLG